MLIRTYLIKRYLGGVQFVFGKDWPETTARDYWYTYSPTLGMDGVE
jgi:hypothetical protein